MTTTPRTDAASIPFHAIKLPAFPSGHVDVNCKFVAAGEMAKLERELQQAKQEVEEAKSRCHCHDWRNQCDQLRREKQELETQLAEQIECVNKLDLKVAQEHYALRQQNAELAAQVERLREALASIFNPKSGACDYEYENNKVSGYSFMVGSKLETDLKHTLSITPSTALADHMKPWVEFVKFASEFEERVEKPFSTYVLREQARKLLDTIK